MKFFFRKLSSFLFAMSLCIGAHAEAANPHDDLLELLQSFHTLTADFSQTILSNDGSDLQKTKGNLSVQRPGLFRWETTSPARQLLIADGQKIWSYDQDLAQVTVQTQSTLGAGAPALLLSGDPETVLDHFRVSLSNDPQNVDDKGVWYRLADKSKSPLFHHVDCHFEDGLLSDMRITDVLGQVSAIHFENIEMNPVLESSLFRFTPKKGVEVIQMDQGLPK